jgi:hypothetical protein
LGFIFSTFRTNYFAAIGETLPKKGIRPQSTGPDPDDVGDGRDTPPAGRQVDLKLAAERLRHAHHSVAGGVFTDQDVRFMVADDENPGSIELEIEEHPCLRPGHEAEARNVLVSAHRQPADPPFRRFRVKNHKPVSRLAVRQLQTTAPTVRTHRAASISSGF